MVNIIIDPDSVSLQNHYAVVYSPRLSRKRFSESCVTLMPDEEQARQQAASANHCHPALVYGPSVSSESQRIYYLVKWLSS